MTKADTVGMVNLPLGERPQYGQPYPEGFAIASISSPDDASGGEHSFSFNADPGFLYRLELVNWTRGEATVRVIHAITVHRWAAARTGQGVAGFDLNYFLRGAGGGGFVVYTLGGGDFDSGYGVMEEIRRFPLGPEGGGAPGVAVQLMLLTNVTNTDGITNELSVVMTYWRKESLYLPGFLSSFHEAPAIPPLFRPQ